MNSTASVLRTELRRPILRRIPSLPDFYYYLRPAPDPATASLLVAVHGIGRDSIGMVRWLGEAADASNCTILAPHFAEKSYSDYQRLGRRDRGARADLAVLRMLQDAERLLDMPCQDVALFGFSGGAQFAHRFVYAHGNLVGSLVCASAGWYTAPDPARRFPNGLDTTRKLPGATFDARRLLETPSLTIVGSLDVARDPALRQTKRVDALQGRNRRARARWWHRTLQASAADPALHEFRELPNTGHEFVEAVTRGGLPRHLFEFVTRDRQTPQDPRRNTTCS